MKTVKATISRPIQIGAIQVGSEIDYYAAHYLALIQCLLYQKNLELSPKRDSMALNWSLANLRAISH
ncbi:hypothetical protein [Diaphorobacter aerolatus]|uniref:Uncharacterized protein n=1 Tax=Diaphorobacter aerolatus TaxID=1288495 RepID=A0A7H0GJE5_9BURK|nr:hypothetical protein [Diaphorobacter aerolatus]QNP48411.1 hypothetical protein H9K75_21050 [Diaphorobacter aerolatus]